MLYITSVNEPAFGVLGYWNNSLVLLIWHIFTIFRQIHPSWPSQSCENSKHKFCLPAPFGNNEFIMRARWMCLGSYFTHKTLPRRFYMYSIDAIMPCYKLTNNIHNNKILTHVDNKWILFLSRRQSKPMDFIIAFARARVFSVNRARLPVLWPI